MQRSSFKRYWCCLIFCGLFCGWSSELFAADVSVPFLNGLRQRGYYDTAEEYLTSLENDPQTSAEMKQRIPYERAVTLIRGARFLNSAIRQREQLDRATHILKKFVGDSPKNALVGNAKSEMGLLFFSKAESAIMALRREADQKQRALFQKNGLMFLANARRELTAAHGIYEIQQKAFPPYIPRAEKKRLAERQRVEASFAFSQIDLAKTNYLEAHLHNRSSPQFQKTLTIASQQFDAIYKRYRSVGYGLYARMWQGKCFEEQGKINRALGIYDELLEHPDRSPQTRVTQRQAMYFRLICLNHPLHANYMLAEIHATDWLKKHSSYSQTSVGLGVRLQRAVARWLISEMPTQKYRQKQYRAVAQNDAAYVARFSGKHQLTAIELLAKIRTARGVKIGNPKNFADAFAGGMMVYRKIKIDLDKIQKAKIAQKSKKEIDELKAILKADLEEVVRLHQLAQQIYQREQPKNAFKLLSESRFTSAYTAYLQSQYFGMHDRLYDALVLAEFTAKQSLKKLPDQAIGAAQLALAIAMRANNLAPKNDRESESDWINRIGNFLVTHWPDSTQTAESCLAIGEIYKRQNRPLLAVRWFARVPNGLKSYFGHSQIHIGLSYWQQYAEALQQQLQGKQSQGGKTESQRDVLQAILLNADRELFIERLANQLNPAWKKWESLDWKLKRLSVQNNPNNSPQIEIVQQQITALKKRSIAELKAALSQKNIAVSAEATEKIMRQQLLKSFADLSLTECRKRYQQFLEQLTDAALEKQFQSELHRWKTAATEFLQIGIHEFTEQIPEKKPAKNDLDDLIVAKATLVELHHIDGRYPAVIRLLKSEPHSVLKVIAIADGTVRPQTGIRSREFAERIYQLLLRAYVGTQQIDDALHAMNELEKLSGDRSQEQLVILYEQLGRNLQEEMERLRQQKKTEKLKAVRESFQLFLDKLFQRKKTLNFNALIWIAKTYYTLGKDAAGESDGTVFFTKALSIYSQLLNHPKTDDAQKVIVQLRQIHCKRAEGNYPGALAIATELIRKKPNNLFVQKEAAETLQSWGADGQPDNHLRAIEGIHQKNIWGWAIIARKCRAQLANSLADHRPETVANRNSYWRDYFVARYNISWNRFLYGMSRSPQKKDPERQKILHSALAEILDFSVGAQNIDQKKMDDPITGKSVDARPQFERLFHDIQLAMGRSENQMIAIRWPKTTVPNGNLNGEQHVDPKQPKQTAAVEKSKKNRKKKKETEEIGTSTILLAVLFSLLLFGGGGWFLYRVLKAPAKRRRY